VAAISALVTLAILASGTARREARRAQSTEAPARKPGPAPETPAERAAFSLGPADFLLPEASLQDQAPAFYPIRGRIPRWSAEQVERYWVPPREVAAGVLGRANDAAMEKFFEQVK
jgi:hypothetical protein